MSTQTPVQIIISAIEAWQSSAEYVVLDHQDDPADLAERVRNAWSNENGCRAEVHPMMMGGTVKVTFFEGNRHCGAVIIPKQTEQTSET